MSDKNYGDIRQLAMGHLSHDEVANNMLQLNASTADLASHARAAHDRILHLAQNVGGTDATEIESVRRELEAAYTQIAELSGQLKSAQDSVTAEKTRADNLQNEVTALNGELQHIKDNYDLSDLDAEGEEEGDLAVEDRENEADFGEREAYMPTRAEIKEIALAQGFRIPQGANDLRDYVYTTAEEVVKLAHTKS